MTNTELIAKAMSNLTLAYFDTVGAEDDESEDAARARWRSSERALTEVLLTMGPDPSVPDDLRKVADDLMEVIRDAIE